MAQEPKQVNPPLSKQEQAACDAIRSVGGDVEFHPESKSLVMLVRMRRPSIRDEHLQIVKSLASRVDWLALSGSSITSEGLVHIARLRKLDTLLLNDTRVDDQGLKHLAGLKNLRALRLDGTKITGKNLGVLMDCPALAQLDIERTPVGLPELRALQKHPSLDRVDLFLSEEAESNPEWEEFWRNLPFVNARAVKLEAQRKRAEVRRKKRGGLPRTTGTQVIRVGDDGQETVVYSTDDEVEADAPLDHDD